jgi:hypothetical protein
MSRNVSFLLLPLLLTFSNLILLGIYNFINFDEKSTFDFDSFYFVIWHFTIFYHLDVPPEFLDFLNLLGFSILVFP